MCDLSQTQEISRRPKNEWPTCGTCRTLSTFHILWHGLVWSLCDNRGKKTKQKIWFTLHLLLLKSHTHRNMLEDLSADAFINGLRCFIAVRGAVRQIQCDQGTNFVGAQNEFKAALQKLDTERLSTFLSQNQCNFILNAPHSSHAGGVWERQIKTVRSVLNTTLSLCQLEDSTMLHYALYSMKPWP